MYGRNICNREMKHCSCVIHCDIFFYLLLEEKCAPCIEMCSCVALRNLHLAKVALPIDKGKRALFTKHVELNIKDRLQHLLEARVRIFLTAPEVFKLLHKLPY